MTYILQRISDSGNETFGTLMDGYTALCCTIERPWKDNENGISCVPIGTYLFYTYQSPTKGKVWRTDQVPNRTAIEIHPANLASQLEGCIATGMSIGQLNGIPAVLGSQKAFKMLQSKLPDQFYLTITGVTS